ncbi:MAG: DUF6434 domain-containing protein [Paracoccaceae bacterium]
MPNRDRESRPAIERIEIGAELRRWYWRKDELVAEARRLGIKTTGGKFLILDRIAHCLDTGETVFPGDKRVAPKSKFDWHSEPLTPETVITDSYKNSQNVRRFFKAELGEGFKFNIAFMEWMRSNTGSTLAEACAAYREIRAAEKTTPAAIPDHNQFNQYTRDFLADNPAADMDEVRRIWALKIARPSDTGRHVYEREDLELE